MAQNETIFRKIASFLPGILLLIVVGYAGKLLGDVFKIKDLFVLIVIGIGFIISNTVGVHKIFEKGVNTYELWLKIGIVLLGGRFLLQQIVKLGGLGLALAVAEVFFAIGLMILLGRLFRLGPKLISLLSIGSSICGVSAILAGKGAIDADERDATFAIAAIMATAGIGIVLYPFIAHLLGLNDYTAGVWIGLSSDNTASAVAAGRVFSEGALKIATLTKTARNALIGFVVLGFAMYWAAKGAAKEIKHKGLFLWQKFPKFVLGFFIFAILSTVGFFNKADITSLKHLYKWFFLFTFAGIGLRTNIKELRILGARPFYCGVIAEAAVAAFNLAIVLAADKLIGF